MDSLHTIICDIIKRKYIMFIVGVFMKKVWVSVLLALFAFCCFGNTALANESFDILNYDIHIHLKADNIIYVVENITVNFKEQRHGLDYQLPIRGEMLHKVNGKWKATPYINKIRDFKVNNEQFTLTQNGDTLNAKIGEEDRLLSGNKTYTVSYTCSLGGDHLTGFDEFFRNLLHCSRWDTIENASFEITMPENLKMNTIEIGIIDFDEGWQERNNEKTIPTFYEMNGWDTSGLDSEQQKNAGEFFGIVDSCDTQNVSWSVDGNTITGRTLRPIEGDEYLTARIILPDGSLGMAYSLDPWEETILKIIGVCVAAGYVLWLLFGVNKRPGKTALYIPTEDMTAAEAGYIMQGDVEDRHIMSLILQWAKSGYIEIADTDTGYKLLKRKNLVSDKYYERTLFAGLFGNREDADIKNLAGEFSETMKSVKHELNAYFITSKQRRLFTMASSSARDMIGLLMIIPITAVLLTSIFMSTHNVLISLLAGAGFGVLLLIPLYMMADIMKKKHKLDKKARIKKMAGAISLLAVILFFYECVFPYFYFENLVIATYVFLLIVIIIYFFVVKKLLDAKTYLDNKILTTGAQIFVYFCFIIPAVMGYTVNEASILILIATAATILLMPLFVNIRKRTKFGKDIYAKISGFSEFLVAVEKQDLITLMEEYPSLFVDMLPYAYALGASKSWAEKFEGIGMDKPGWFHAFSDEEAFSSVKFASAIASSLGYIGCRLSSENIKDDAEYKYWNEYYRTGSSHGGGTGGIGGGGSGLGGSGGGGISGSW